MEKTDPRFQPFKKNLQRVPIFILAALGLIGLLSWSRDAFGVNVFWVSRILDTTSNFAAVFLGIFIEAAPFLLMGTLASGFVEFFFKPEDLARLLPRNKVTAVLTGSLLGLFFPVCECGSVPLARRLMRKGLPVSVGVAFLLAAPVINPIVIASTLAAFGSGQIFWLRIGLTLSIATITGIIFSFDTDPKGILRSTNTHSESETLTGHFLGINQGLEKVSLGRRLKGMMVVAGDEFFEMGRYLIIGAMLAALMQTFIPQTLLLSVGQGPILSVVVLSVLAVVLSICSTVDSFIALAFTGTFTNGAILAFLVFGPMVDIKAIFMYVRVFQRRPVVYLVVLPFLLILVAGVLINLLAG